MSTTIPQPCSPEQAISIQIAELIDERRTVTDRSYRESLSADIRYLSAQLRAIVR